MTPALQAREHFQEWSGSTQGYSAISEFVQYRLIHQHHGGSLTAVWPYPRWQDCDPANQCDLKEEVAHDFLSYIYSKILSRLEKQPVLTHKLLSGHYRIFLENCWQMFIWEWQETARNKNSNPLGYLYRRFREALSNSQLVAINRRGDGMLFYAIRNPASAADTDALNTLAGESFQGWPLPENPPPSTGAEDFRVTNGWLTDMALFFWNQAKSQDQTVEWLAVRELVRYLGTAFPWLNKPLLVSHSVAPEDEEAPLASYPAYREEEESRIDRLRQLQSVAPLILQLVDTWSDDECCVFTWRLEEPPLSFEKIAARLEMKSHNQAYALFKKTENALKFFCRNWPGPPDDDLDKDVFFYFIEKVKEQAKKRCGRP